MFLRFATHSNLQENKYVNIPYITTLVMHCEQIILLMNTLFWSISFQVIPLGGGPWRGFCLLLFRRKFNAASRLLLLSISACLAASLLKPISVMCFRAFSSTWKDTHINYHKLQQRLYKNIRFYFNLTLTETLFHISLVNFSDLHMIFTDKLS